MTLEEQYMTLLVMSINGTVLGAVYDMYRVVLRHWKFLRWASPIFDFAFWIFAIFIVFWSLMWASNGELRIYVFVVMIIGFIIYRIFFRRAVVGSTVGIIMAIRYISLTVYRAFLVFVVRPLNELWRVLLTLLRALDRLLRALEQIILWPFKALKKVLIWSWRNLLKISRMVVRPVIRPLEPYVRRIIRRIEPKIKSVLRRTRLVMKKGKGIWLRLTNWLLNRDDNNPKP